MVSKVLFMLGVWGGEESSTPYSDLGGSCSAITGFVVASCGYWCALVL
mgnify:CR=1